MSEPGEELVVLRHAAQLGRTDVLKQAISSIRALCSSDQEASVMISSGVGEDDSTALHIAAFHGHPDVIRALLTAGADPAVIPARGEYTGKKVYDVATDKVKETISVFLLEQIAMGNNETISRLLAPSTGIPAPLTDGSRTEDTSLHWACSFSNEEATNILIRAGIDVNKCNTLGQTALHVACKGGNTNIIRAIVKAKCNVTAVDNNGKSALDMASGSVFFCITSSLFFYIHIFSFLL